MNAKRYTVRKSAPGQIAAAARVRTTTSPDPVASQRSRRRNDLLSVVGSSLILLCGVWYFGFHSGRYQLTQVEVGDTRYVPQDQVKHAVDQFLTSRWLGIVPRDTYWTLSEDRLARFVENQLTDTYALSGVTAQKTRPHQLQVSVTERIPSVTWITTDSGGVEHYYSVDVTGRVTTVMPSYDARDASLPVIHDDNRGSLGVDWQVISPEYLQYVIDLQQHFTEIAGFALDGFRLPKIECTERQFVAKQIFEKEILESKSDEFKEKKRDIQERFQLGELTVDESLQLLEDVKNEELSRLDAESPNGTSDSRLEWEAVLATVDCDLVQVAQEVTVVTAQTDDQGSFLIKMLTSGDLRTQLDNAVTVIRDKHLDIDTLQYIDVRVPDRVYYK